MCCGNAWTASLTTCHRRNRDMMPWWRVRERLPLLPRGGRKAIAAALGVNPMTVTAWRQGKHRSDAETHARIVAYLDALPSIERPTLPDRPPAPRKPDPAILRRRCHAWLDLLPAEHLIALYPGLELLLRPPGA
jgi:hypothetical protein